MGYTIKIVFSKKFEDLFYETEKFSKIVLTIKYRLIKEKLK
jgi:hypothetical protein